VWKSSFARWLAGGLLLVLLAAHATHWLTLAPVSVVERQFYDLRLALFAPRTPDPRIVIVDIDEKALAEHGRWPWPRGLLADLLARSFDQGALIAGIDLVLAEPDHSSGLAALERLAAGPLRGDGALAAQLPGLRATLDDDGRLAAVLQAHPVVLGFYFSESAVRSAALPAPLTSAGQPGLPSLSNLPNWPGYAGNLPRLQAAAGQAGFLNALADADGVTRRSLLLARHGDAVYASLPLVLATTLQGQRALPPTHAGTVGVPFRTAAGAYRRVSAADVLAGRVAADSLRGRIVLIGSTAPGLLDQLATPLATLDAGVAVNASVLTGLLDGTLTHTPGDAAAIELLHLLAVGALVLLVLPRLSARNGLLLTGALAGAALGLNAWAWVQWQQAWPIAGPLLALGGLGGLHVGMAYRGERSARRQITALFGQYVPPAVVAAMSRDPLHHSMASRSAELTVLFADVRGFTGIAESLAPTALAELMSAYFSAMTAVIGAHGGTVDKFIGDAVMAFWGAPLPDAAHARHAVQAALAMQARLVSLNAEFSARGWPELAVTTGINTGPMVVGDLGSHERRTYTVLGDAVNLAARLQTLCSEMGAAVLMGPLTQAQAALPSVARGAVQMRGRSGVVEVFEPLAA